MISTIATRVYTGLGVAACAGLAAGMYAYASMWPDSQLFGTALTAPPRPGELALTFDDGPNAIWTPKLLEILAKHNVRATFFVLGERAKVQPELVRSMARAGHVIGNHSWDHPNMAKSGASVIREQMVRTQNMLEQIAGTPIKFFRPPFGARRPAVFKAAREMGLQVVLWNAMTSDWSDPSPDRIALRLTNRIERLRQAGRAANVVLHDGGHSEAEANRVASVVAAERLIERHKAGYKFVTLDEWV